MQEFHYMLFKDGSWCNMAGASEYLKNLDTWIEVTGDTTPLDIASHIDDEKMTGSIIHDMLG